MSATLYYRRSSMLRDVLNTLAYTRRRVFLVGLAGVMLTIGAALLISPTYRANSTLLVLLGTEYTYRGVAGETAGNNGAMTRQQILETEADILGSDGLRRTVIGQIGIAQLYPQLLKPPTGLNAWIGKAKSYVKELLTPSNLAKHQAPIDPMTLASMQFSSHLSIQIDKDASVIHLGFTNPDAQLAAEVLKRLEADYLALRARLFNDVQAPVLQTQVTALAQRLTAADNALATFKGDHKIGDYEARRTILLKEQGELEEQLQKSESHIAEQNARLGDLQRQVHVASNDGGRGRANPGAALQAMAQQYRAREMEAQTRYMGSAAQDRAKMEALQRETDLARLRASNAFAVQQEVIKTDADLRASLAGREAITQQLADVTGQVRAINGDELRLRELQRALAVADENYRTGAKILDERRLVENTQAGKQPDVRIIQPPLVPEMPVPIRRMVLAAGVLLTLIMMAATALLAHFFRTIYFGAEALELDTELTVLTSVPETKALPRLGIAVGPN